MTTNENTEILSAVIESRDALGANLDDQILEEILSIEMLGSNTTTVETALRRTIENAISRQSEAGGDR